MPTATAFRYPKEFSPLTHCAASKTTAELDAMALSRWEGSLSDVMNLWWNLYTVDISLTEGAHATQTANPCQPVCKVHSGGFTTAIVPKDRVCSDINNAAGSGNGLVFGDNFDPFGIDPDQPLTIAFQRVYFNSTSGLYALMYELAWTTTEGISLSTPGMAGAPSVTNTGTVTFLGQTIATVRTSARGNTAVTFSNPAYYTY